MESEWTILEPLTTAWLAWMIPMTWQVGILVGAVWLVSKVFHKASSEFHALIWVLVFVRLALPPSVSAPWSAAEWAGIDSSVLTAQQRPMEAIEQPISLTGGYENSAAVSSPIPAGFNWPLMRRVAFCGWAAIAFGLFAAVASQYWRYWRRVRGGLCSPPSALQARFEEQLRALGMPNTVLLRLSDAVDTPGVFGVNVPIVILPKDAADRFDTESLSAIMAHELAHIQRRDLPIGWGASMLACAYWFHPLVWFALLQYRRNRELSCDEIALRDTSADGLGFARTILRVAETSRQPVPLSVGFLGILERSSNLKRRIKAARRPYPARKLSNVGLGGILALAVLLLPMGNWSPETSAQEIAVSQAPKVVSTQPKIGAKGIDPDAQEIRVTFDQDMKGGFSWTGGGEAAPKVTSKPKWIDKRTCVLPVALERAKFYRIGINASGFGNFRGANGKQAELNVIYFTTEGADKKIRAKRAAPKIVSMNPPKDATDVDPGLSELTVTFKNPMGQGFSWVKTGDGFPTTTQPATWSDDRRSSTLPVELKPGTTYRLGLNSIHHNNFQTEFGVPLPPVAWEFTTKSE